MHEILPLNNGYLPTSFGGFDFTVPSSLSFEILSSKTTGDTTKATVFFTLNYKLKIVRMIMKSVLLESRRNVPVIG